MGRKEFKAKLDRFEGVGTWTYVEIPFDVEKAFGRGGQLRIKAKINGVPFRSSLMPNGDGSHFLVVNKSVRDKAKIKMGDRVAVVIEPDAAARVIEAPPDLAKALSRNKTAKSAWDAFAYSHKKAYVDWVTSAKRDETRKRRIDKAVAMMAEKKLFK